MTYSRSTDLTVAELICALMEHDPDAPVEGAFDSDCGRGEVRVHRIDPLEAAERGHDPRTVLVSVD